MALTVAGTGKNTREKESGKPDGKKNETADQRVSGAGVTRTKVGIGFNTENFSLLISR